MNLTRRGLFKAIAGTAALAPFAAKAREWTTITVDEVIQEVTPTDSPFLMVGKQNAPAGVHEWATDDIRSNPAYRKAQEAKSLEARQHLDNVYRVKK